MKNKFDRTGLPGIWSWPDLWWKAQCGCKGYGRLVIMPCFDPGAGIRPSTIQLTPCPVDMGDASFGKLSVTPLTLQEKMDLIATVEREFALGRFAREMLKVMREIGKLTNGG